MNSKIRSQCSSAWRNELVRPVNACLLAGLGRSCAALASSAAACRRTARRRVRLSWLTVATGLAARIEIQ